MALSEPWVFNTTWETYTATKIIGEGGAARVFEANDVAGKRYAVKLLDPSTKVKVKRFQNEYSFCANNKHRNVVTMVDHGLFGEQELPFVVMPLYGGSLRTLLESGVEPGQVLSYFAQLMDGLECAHLQNVIHRDLKPENVLFDHELDLLLLADFGIAHFAEDELFTAVETKANDRLANFRYAAPEQKIPGADVDHRADIFALGLILNEMFTGEVPDGTGYKTIEQVSPDHAYLDDIVSHMIRHGSGDRPGSVEEVKRLLIAHENDFIMRQRISGLTQAVVPVTEIDDALIADPVRLVEVENWDGSQLTLILSQPVNDKWISVLQHGMGGHSSIMGYGPERFSFRENKAIIGCEARLVQPIIDHFKDWLPRANTVYKETVERDAQRAEEAERKQLQQRLAAEQARQTVLRNIRI